jgi:hypothetical protein
MFAVSFSCLFADLSFSTWNSIVVYQCSIRGSASGLHVCGSCNTNVTERLPQVLLASAGALSTAVSVYTYRLKPEVAGFRVCQQGTITIWWA